MQNKTAIQIFTVVFALVCLFQISFTWIGYQVREDAKAYANGDLKKENDYLDSIKTKPVYNLGIKNYTYQEVQSNEINLGLDLKGGMNVTLEVSTVDLIRSMANNSQNPTFLQALQNAQEAQKHSNLDFVTLFGQEFKKLDANAQLKTIFSTLELKDKINFESTDEEVLTVIRAEANSAIDRTFNILRTRIDKFGVTQPNIQKLGNSGRILVELPGVKDPERVRGILQQTAQLEFWETYEAGETYPVLEKVNSRLAQMNVSGEGKEGADKEDALGALTSPDSTVVADSSKVTIDQTAQETATSKEDSINDALNALLGTGDSTGSDTSASAQNKSFEEWSKDNPLFAVLHPLLDSDNRLRSGPMAGYAAIKDTGKINEYLNMPEIRNLMPRDMMLRWGVKAFDDEGRFLHLYALKVTNRDGKPILAGDVVIDARQEFGQNRANAEVVMVMNPQGANSWKKITKEASSQTPKRAVAVVLDGYVYSAPTVQGEIPNGISTITGDFDIKEAEDLANVLKAGKLPAPARIVQEAVVGPSLGDEAIRSGFISFAIALILVLVYMVFYYSNAGMVANVALMANIFFILGVLASLGAVLTLPGVAGIVLTIGMAVDANVLIYERIREELHKGKGVRLALKDGYMAAYSSIVDANVTTMLTGIVLYVFGTGPIQGFATTLIIGILTSLFAGIFITRLVFIWMMDKDKGVRFSTKATENLLKNVAYKFVEKRKIYYAVSGTLILLGIGSLVTKGLNYGIDFVGGRNYVVRFDKDVSTTQIQEALKVPFGGEVPEVKTFGESNQVSITTKYMIDQEGSDVEQQVEDKLKEGISTVRPDGWEVMGSQTVGPTIADDIKQNAVWAIVFSLFVIFVYILIRFKKWQFGLGALLALFHDVALVVSCFSLLDGIVPFSMEINQAFIAAILTVIGYSINDTVVVFDRIREYLAEHKRSEMGVVINNALNSTLSRTFNTSMTVFLVLLAIFLLGGEVIRGFSFALLVGVVVGTYSSICIATPVVIDLAKKGSQEDKK